MTFFLLSCAERTRHGSPDLSPRGAPVQPRPSSPIRGVDAGDQSASATFRRETGRWHGHDQYSILGRADRHLGVLLDYRIRGTDGEPTNPILLDDRNVTTPLLRRRMNRSPAAIDGCRLSTASGVDVDTFTADFMTAIGTSNGVASPRLGPKFASGQLTFALRRTWQRLQDCSTRCRRRRIPSDIRAMRRRMRLTAAADALDSGLNNACADFV